MTWKRRTDAEAVALARALLSATQGFFPGRPGSDTPAYFIWAAGFLARCRVLLSGMATLVEHGDHDAVGALYRPLLETALSGLYVLLGKDEAVATLQADHTARVYRIEVELGERHKGDRPEGAQELGVKSLVERVGGLLEENDETTAGEHAVWCRKAYSHHYGPLSFHDVHGGFGALSQYVSEDETGPLVVAGRPREAVAVLLVDMATTLVLMLAMLWSRQTDKDVTELNGVARAWAEVEQAMGAAHAADAPDIP